jgi:beta-glucanase (GH16 family)
MMLLLLVACQGPSLSPTPVEGWRLTWADEFDAAEGEGPAEPWGFDEGATGWGNAELQSYTRDNALHNGEGQLVITAREEAVEGAAYTSARLNTKGRFAQQYGRFEARLRVPAGQGLWPAFWLLGADIDTVGWPTCGELDAMEVRGAEPETVQSAAHGLGFSGGASIYDSITLDEGSLADDFFTYAVQIDEGRVSFWFDDQRVMDLTAADLPEGSAWPFDKPMFPIVNLAVGGTFGGDPDETTVFPAELVVDHVRVYARGD